VRILRNVIIAILLILIIGVSAYYRIVMPSTWLQGQTLRMSTVDAYYQLRMAEMIKSSGVDLSTTDPYFQFAGGTTFDKAKNPIIWPMIISGASNVLDNFKVPNSLEIAAFYLPPLFALLSIIGVFALGTLLFNAWAGVIAALLMGTFAGEFMGRSIVGSADYHVFEVFLLVYFMLFLFSANRAQEAGKNILGLIFAIFAGLALAVYSRAWAGTGYLFLFLSAAYMIYLIILSLRKEIPSGAIFAIMTTILSSTVFFYIVITIVTSTNIDMGLLVLMAICFAIILIATPVQTFCVSRFNKFIFPVVSFVLVAVAGLVLFIFAKSYYEVIFNYFRPLFAWQYETRTAEELPSLLAGNQFTLNTVWGNFSASLYLCLVGIGMFMKRAYKAPRFTVFDYTFLLVATVIMLLSTLAMRRFSYYFVIFVSLFAGIVTYTMVKVVIDYLKRNKGKLKWFDKLSDVFLLAIILAFIFVPNFVADSNFSSPMEGTMTPGWEDATLWLKSNTPEPFSDNNYYYANYNGNVLKPQYSVLSWWDYGYWIMYLGHRVPVCNPGSFYRDQAAAFLTTTDLDGAKNMLSHTKSRYIVIDYQMTTGKFSAMPTYMNTSTPEIKALSGLGEEGHNYMDVYSIGSVYREKNGELQQVNIFYPDYYKTMAVRLFNFDGKQVKSPGCPVVIFSETNGAKVIDKIIDTASYDEAVAYTNTLKLDKGQSFALCGLDPFISCVDLEELTDYRLVKQSSAINLNFMTQKTVAEVKIFEYTGEFR
jgi:oligosaccharyl transferase (archaeosortase A-associated)